MSHTADPNSPLGFWCRKVAALKPGQCLDIDVRDLQDIPSFIHNEATFTPADRILGNIIGSNWTHSYQIHPSGAKVTFMRHEDNGTRRSYDPDRRPADAA